MGVGDSPPPTFSSIAESFVCVVVDWLLSLPCA